MILATGFPGGPYIDETGLWVAIAIIIVFKPLAYYGFIQAFRFRVSRPIPMTFKKAFMLTLFRAGLGVMIFLFGWTVGGFLETGGNWIFIWIWIYFYLARVGAWFVVGKYGAGLRGRRLIGWIISGTLINVAFDSSVVFGAFAGPIGPFMVLGGIILFLVPLHLIGRRASLKARFTLPLCSRCQYNLIGNLSGVCPECGTPVSSLPLPP